MIDINYNNVLRQTAKFHSLYLDHYITIFIFQHPAPFSRREQLVFPTTELKGAQLKVGRVINHSLKKASESP